MHEYSRGPERCSFYKLEVQQGRRLENSWCSNNQLLIVPTDRHAQTCLPQAEIPRPPATQEADPTTSRPE